MKNTISEIKNPVEGIKRGLNEAEDLISELKDKVEKNSPKEIGKENERLKKNDDRLRGLQDIIVTQYNNIQKMSIKCIKGIPRTSNSGDQGNCTTESHRPPTIAVHTTKSENQNRSI